MARPPPHPYLCVPPPPLPELYQHKVSGAQRPNSCMLANPSSAMAAVPIQHLPRTPSVTYVPPLAVYHICRICLRTRSARYHREHPIPINAVPPPPGICRRCRVTTVEEHTTTTEVVETAESNDVKLGIRCLVPEDDYFSREEMERNRASYILSQAEQNEPNMEKKRISYRHLRTIDSPPRMPARPNPNHQMSAGREASSSVSQNNVTRATAILADFSERTSSDLLASSRTSSAGQVMVTECGQYGHSQASNRPSSSSSSDEKPVVRERRSRTAYDASVKVSAASDKLAESDLREIVREEVERYRQAERKLQAHSNPYAHGRLVPVHRNIVQDHGTAHASPRGKSCDASPAHHHEERPLRLRHMHQDRTANIVVEREQQHRSACDRPLTGPADKGHHHSGPQWGLQATASSKVSPSRLQTRANSPGKLRSTRSRHESRKVAHMSGAPSLTRTRSRSADRETLKASCEAPLSKYIVTEVIEATHRSPNQPRAPALSVELSNAAQSEEVRHSMLERDRTDSRKWREGTSFAKDERSELPHSNTSNWTDRAYWLPEQPTDAAGSQSSKWYRREEAEQHGKAVNDARRPKSLDQRESLDETRWVSTSARQRSPKTDVHRSGPQRSMLSARDAYAESQDASARDLTLDPRDGAPRRAAMNVAIPSLPRGANIPLGDRERGAASVPKGEYMYVDHTLQKSRRDQRRPFYESRTQEYLEHRRRAPASAGLTTSSRDHGGDVQPRDASGVRFSNQIKVSPAPPGSDASSREFRQIGQKGQSPTTGYENENRGRSRARESVEQADHPGSAKTPIFVSERGRDRSKTLAPSVARMGRQDVVMAGNRPKRLALPRSPSRSELIRASKEQDDEYGPYVLEDERSRSRVAQDGSAVGDIRSGSSTASGSDAE